MADLHLIAVEPAVLPRPNAFSSAMPITMTCIETRMVGTAIRSSGPKSLIDFTFGLRVSILNGMPAIPVMVLMLPVLPQASSMFETPVVAMSTVSERIASVITPPEVITR